MSVGGSVVRFGAHQCWHHDYSLGRNGTRKYADCYRPWPQKEQEYIKVLIHPEHFQSLPGAKRALHVHFRGVYMHAASGICVIRATCKKTLCLCVHERTLRVIWTICNPIAMLCLCFCSWNHILMWTSFSCSSQQLRTWATRTTVRDSEIDCAWG